MAPPAVLCQWVCQWCCGRTASTWMHTMFGNLLNAEDRPARCVKLPSDGRGCDHHGQSTCRRACHSVRMETLNARRHRQIAWHPSHVGSTPSHGGATAEQANFTPVARNLTALGSVPASVTREGGHCHGDTTRSTQAGAHCAMTPQLPPRPTTRGHRFEFVVL